MHRARFCPLYGRTSAVLNIFGATIGMCLYHPAKYHKPTAPKISLAFPVQFRLFQLLSDVVTCSFTALSLKLYRPHTAGVLNLCLAVARHTTLYTRYYPRGSPVQFSFNLSKNRWLSHDHQRLSLTLSCSKPRSVNQYSQRGF